MLLIEGINPVFWSVGPIQLRWYGLMMAVSVAIGGYLFYRGGRRAGMSENLLMDLMIAALIGGIIGARVIYVVTNFSDFSIAPLEALRIYRGGLSFHGGLGGGILTAYLVARRHGTRLQAALDLAVPGIAIGYTLVRLANISNQEILGRPASLLVFERHPTQLYGSAIGLMLLVLHVLLSRSRLRRPGELFWIFFLAYSLLRGVIEETFRDNPLYAWGFVSEAWGVGLFTLTQLLTPALLAVGWLMLVRTRRVDPVRQWE